MKDDAKNQQLKKVCDELNKALSTNQEIKREIKLKEERFDANFESITHLDIANKTLKIEAEELNRQAKYASKVVKTKEKEVTKSTVKIDNMNETITNLKKENKCLIIDKKKAVKDKLKLNKKLSDMKVSKSVTIKSTNISTNTVNLDNFDDETVEEVRVDKLSVCETIKEESKEIEAPSG